MVKDLKRDELIEILRQKVLNHVECKSNWNIAYPDPEQHFFFVHFSIKNGTFKDVSVFDQKVGPQTNTSQKYQ